MRVGSPQTRRKAGAGLKAASMRRSERNAPERTTRGAGGIGAKGRRQEGRPPPPGKVLSGGLGRLGNPREAQRTLRVSTSGDIVTERPNSLEIIG